jgi:hypothetical protein
MRRSNNINRGAELVITLSELGLKTSDLNILSYLFFNNFLENIGKAAGNPPLGKVLLELG